MPLSKVVFLQEDSASLEHPKSSADASEYELLFQFSMP